MNCAECGGTEFCDDYARGDRVCSGCGATGDTLRVAAPRYNELFDASGNRRVARAVAESYPIHATCATVFSAGRRRRAVSSAPYKRSTYWAERISQWQQNEPRIPTEDWDEIECAYLDEWWDAAPVEPPALDKDRIRGLLRSLDLARKRDEDLAPEDRKPRFVRKYLEKWLTIRYQLTGIESRGCRVSYAVVDELKYLFNVIQPAFDLTCKHPGSRFSMLNYNFLFRRFFDLINRSDLCVDFPPLKSQAKRANMVQLWLEITHNMCWPYLNSDGDVFGPAFYVDPWQCDSDGNGDSPGTPTRPAEQRRPASPASPAAADWNTELLDLVATCGTAPDECRGDP